jgi:hypothetical protein
MINTPTENGLVVDCSRAWQCLAQRARHLVANHTERAINPSNLILGQLDNWLIDDEH